MSVKQISAEELHERLTRGEAVQLLDVREPWEYELAHLPGSRLVPLRTLHEHHEELDRTRELVVLCHHGIRSMHAIGLLRSFGFEQLTNLRGGIDAYSAVDPKIPTY